MIQKALSLLVATGLIITGLNPAQAQWNANRRIPTQFTHNASRVANTSANPFRNASINARQSLYNYAKQGNTNGMRQILQQYRIDTPDSKGNSLLCESVYNKDYAAFTTLKRMGASMSHSCINRIPDQTVAEFNQEYMEWAKAVNAGKISYGTTYGTAGKATGAVATTTGLSTGAMVGIGVGAAALIGGGIAIASSGGGSSSSSGGGSSSSTETVCSGHGTKTNDICSCNAGYIGDNCEYAKISNCATQSGNTCSACSGGYTLSNNACVANQTSTIANCKTQNGTTCTECNTGYTLSNNSCVANTCSSTNTSTTGCSSYTTCTSPTGTFYTCTICNSGYTKNGNACVANTCTSTNTSRTGCSSYDTCTTPSGNYYTCSVCESNYTLTNGVCVAASCSSTNTSKTGCKQYESCTSSAGVFYTCSECNSGYTLTSGACVANTCSSTNTSTTGCTSYDTCTSPSGSFYTCKGCNNGYTLTNGACVANTCSTSNTSTTGCSSYNTCTTPSGNYYICTACNTGYTLNNGICEQNQTSTIANCKTQSGNTCSECNNGFTLVSNKCFTTISNCSTYNSSTGACTGCKSNYTLNSGSCVQNATETIPNCKIQTGTTCSACNVGYVLSNNTCTKISCSQNQYWTGTSCESCLNGGTSAGSSASSCTCSGNWYGDNCGSCKLSGDNISSSTCTCSEGYKQSGTSCVASTEELTCADEYNLTTCPNNANCSSCTDTSGTKVMMLGCQTGYTNLGNADSNCFPIITCNGHGRQVSDGLCSCDSGYAGDLCETAQTSSASANYSKEVRVLWQEKDIPSNNIYTNTTDITVDNPSDLVQMPEGYFPAWNLSENDYESIYWDNHFQGNYGYTDTNDSTWSYVYAPILYAADPGTSGGNLTLKNTATIKVNNADDNAWGPTMLGYGANVENSGTLGSHDSCKGSGYTLTVCPSHGVCDTCTSITGKTFYKLTGCESETYIFSTTNYFRSGNSCIASDMFPLGTNTSCPEHGICQATPSVTGTRYNLTGCEEGYVIQGGGMTSRCVKEEDTSDYGSLFVISDGAEIYAKNSGTIYGGMYCYGINGKVTCTNESTGAAEYMYLMGNVEATNEGRLNWSVIDGSASLRNKGTIQQGVLLFKGTLTNDGIIGINGVTNAEDDMQSVIQVMGPSTIYNNTFGRIYGDIAVIDAYLYSVDMQNQTVVYKPTRASLTFENHGTFSGSVKYLSEELGLTLSVENYGTYSLTNDSNLSELNYTAHLNSTTNFNEKAEGIINLSSDIVMNGFKDQYVSKDIITASDTNGLSLVSQSAMFDAKLVSTSDTTHDVVMTKKAFNTLTSNSSLANFLEQNYALGNNEAFYNELKEIGSTSAFKSGLNSLTGMNVLNRFAYEDLTAIREMNLAMNQQMFANDDKNIFTTQGSLNNFSFKNGEASSGQFALGNRKVSPNLRVGYAMSVTRLNTNDEANDNSRNSTIFQMAMPFNYNTKGLKMISTPMAGFARGHYSRTGFNDSSYDGIVEKRMFGWMNEMRYPFKVSGFELAPTFELNAIAYNQKGGEDDKPYSLTIKSDNNLSVEVGVGMYASKDYQFSKDAKLNLNAGMMLYHEFSNPYNMKLGMQGMSGSFDLYDEDRSEYRGVASFGLDYKAEDLDIYGAVQHYMEDETHTNVKSGLKWKF